MISVTLRRLTFGGIAFRRWSFFCTAFYTQSNNSTRPSHSQTLLQPKRYKSNAYFVGFYRLSRILQIRLVANLCDILKVVIFV
jgi:hypothetical protein